MASVGFGRFLATLALGSTVTTMACASPADCSTEALAESSPAQRLSLISGRCSDVTQYSLEAPRARPIDVGPSLVKARFGSATSESLFDGLLGTFKFNWSGQRTAQETALRTDVAAVGAGGLLRLADFWSVQMNYGREIGVSREPGVLLRTRTALTNIFRPTRESMFFAEWAENEAGLAQQRVGAQWWLLPKRLVLDVGARYLPEGMGWTDHRVGIKFQMVN